MPSQAYRTWDSYGRGVLDEIEAARRSVRRTGVGARLAASQINQAYVVLLAGQFQAFCRDLHTEGIDHLLGSIPVPEVRLVVKVSLSLGRKLDGGNANAGNLGSDFGRFGFPFWVRVDAQQFGNDRRRRELDELNRWRNAVAHQDFAPAMRHHAWPNLNLSQVRDWRVTCGELAESFDQVLQTQLQYLTGSSPW